MSLLVSMGTCVVSSLGQAQLAIHHLGHLGNTISPESICGCLLCEVLPRFPEGYPRFIPFCDQVTQSCLSRLIVILRRWH